MLNTVELSYRNAKTGEPQVNFSSKYNSVQNSLNERTKLNLVGSVESRDGDLVDEVIT